MTERSEQITFTSNNGHPPILETDADLPTEFTSQGQRCAASLFLPEGRTPRGGVLVINGFACTRRMRLGLFVGALVESGFAVLTYDPRHFGDSEGEPRQLLDPDRLVADAHAAVAHLRDLDGVGVLGVLGVSFGGGIAMQVVIDDPSICALAHLVGHIEPGEAPREGFEALAAAAMDDLAAAEQGLPPVMVPVVGWPGEVAVFTTYDAMYGGGLLDVDGRMSNELVARSLLPASGFAPGRRAAEITCPVLYYACEDDSMVPFETTRRAAAATPDCELVSYHGSHFDVYKDTREGDAAATTIAEFFERKVAPRPHASDRSASSVRERISSLA